MKLGVHNPLMFHKPSLETIPCMVKGPLHRARHNSKDYHNYSIVNYLAQSQSTMLVLEFLQTFPTQNKALIYASSAIDWVDSNLMTFDLDNSTPCILSIVAFQIISTIHNINIRCCIIHEGESTSIMSKSIWHKLISLELTASPITLRAYDRYPSTLVIPF